MDKNNHTKNLSFGLPQSQYYHPHKLISPEDLAMVVASHEKLQRWNDATESALALDPQLEDATLIQNIRNTAAMVASTHRSVASQNFELMRAMNISDRTLSASVLAESFAEGALDEVMSPVRALVEMQQPSDMNPEHAKIRAEALEHAVMQLGLKALDIANSTTHHVESAWEHPENIVQSVNHQLQGAYDDYQISVDQIPMRLANSLKDKNAEQTLGFGFGAATVAMMRNVATTNGRVMRDFSEEMKFYPDERDIEGNRLLRVFYNPTEGHSINGYVDTSGQLHYHIIKSDGDHHGHGDEMFASMVEKFRQNGIEIYSIRDTWRVNGRDSTNGHQFLEALSKGLTPEDAAFETFTGRQAKALGINQVVIPPADSGSPFKPVFTNSNLQGPDDKNSRVDILQAKDIILGHLKTLGLPIEKEQLAIARVESNINTQSRDDSLSV